MNDQFAYLYSQTDIPPYQAPEDPDNNISQDYFSLSYLFIMLSLYVFYYFYYVLKLESVFFPFFSFNSLTGGVLVIKLS